MKRKNDLMYELFGKSEGLCKDCKHFKSLRYHDYRYRKCSVYGETCSGASDWAGKWQACGLYPDKEYNGREVIKLVRGGKPKKQIQVDGQMDLFSQEG